MKAAIDRPYLISIQLSVIVLGLIIAYWETISIMAQQWLGNDDFSYGLLIVPISAYLVWERRAAISKQKLYTDWRALVPLLLAIAFSIIGELGAEGFTIRFAFLLFFIGAVWMLYGAGLLKILRFPLLFLFLMLPLPGFIYRNLTFPLQILSSKYAVAFLNLLGILAYREGNVIDLGFTQLQVVEACNGLRFILPLFTLGVLFAFWKYKPLWKRLLLVGATIPIAIAANIFRIGGTGILSKCWGPEAAEGFFHGFSGWFVFMLSFILFFGLNWLLGFLPGKEASKAIEKETVPEESAPLPARKAKLKAFVPFLVLLALILATPLAVKTLGDVAPNKLKQPLSNFPLTIEDRVGETRELDAEIWKQVGGQEYFTADYKKYREAPINFYVAYYEYQRKAGDFIHSPKLCLPGSGWFIASNQARTIERAEQSGVLDKLRLNDLVIQKGEAAELVYYWYQGRDRNFTNEYAAKFWMVWDGIFRRRTDGALVRVVMPLSSMEAADRARPELDRFALHAAEILNEFLP